MISLSVCTSVASIFWSFWHQLIWHCTWLVFLYLAIDFGFYTLRFVVVTVYEVKLILVMWYRLSIIGAYLVSAPCSSFTWCFAAYSCVLSNAGISVLEVDCSSCCCSYYNWYENMLHIVIFIACCHCVCDCTLNVRTHEKIEK